MKRRLLLAVAWIATLPGALVTLAALAYLGYALITDELYRDQFGPHGAALAGLYVVFLAGLAGAARATARPGHARRSLGFAILGVLAALGLEWQFAADDDFPLHGLFLAPFVVWGIVAWLLRSRAPHAAPATS